MKQRVNNFKEKHPKTHKVMKAAAIATPIVLGAAVTVIKVLGAMSDDHYITVPENSTTDTQENKD